MKVEGQKAGLGPDTARRQAEVVAHTHTVGIPSGDGTGGGEISIGNDLLLVVSRCCDRERGAQGVPRIVLALVHLLEGERGQLRVRQGSW